MATATYSPDTLLEDFAGNVRTAVHEQHGGQSGDDWREDPAPFDHFVESSEHLGMPPLFSRQREAINELLGPDPKRIFEEPEPPALRPLKWGSVRSTNVAGVAHHGDALYVRFRDGNAYRYDGAPAEKLARALRRASSPGGYLARHVKGRYRHERLEEPPDSILVTDGETTGRAYQLGVLLWGKGSGKDYVCSIVVTYLLHVLLCLRDPQGFFDFAPGESIDVINVAYNADQAKRVFFEKLKQRLKRWRWLRERFNILESGRRMTDWHPGRSVVEINDEEVLFPRLIRCFSRHAQNESYEGFNVIAWIMDEASAFLSKLKRENAELIYQTLRTSASSRFGMRWLGLIISWPRHGDDFTMTKLAEAQRNPELGMYGDGPATTWEVNELTARGPFVEVRPGFAVPVAFVNDFRLDFEEALARLCCSPPAARDALFKYPERLDQAVAQGRRPLVEWSPHVTRRTVIGPDGEPVEREFAAVRLTRLGRLPKGARVFMHGDPGLKRDSFALCIGHGVPATIQLMVPAGEVLTSVQLAKRKLEVGQLIPWDVDVTRVVIDALIMWEPDPARDRLVDLLNVREVLLELVKRYRPRGVTFDQWNSAETIQTLQTRKVNVEDEQWSNPFQLAIYRHARSIFYNDLVTLPDTPSITSADPIQPGALYELKRVEEIEARKIDHPEGGSKDLADAVVRVIQHVAGDDRKGFSYGTAFGHASMYPQHAPAVPVPGKKTDPRTTPTPISETEQELEAERRMARPLGEILPSEGTIEGRRLAFGSINRNR